MKNQYSSLRRIWENLYPVFDHDEVYLWLDVQQYPIDHNHSIELQYLIIAKYVDNFDRNNSREENYQSSIDI
jgi:hypothetical protein